MTEQSFNAPMTAGASSPTSRLADDDRRIRGALAECRLRTTSRGEGEDDTKARMEIYARDLRQYATPRVLAVLGDWPRRNKFFPTWAELVDELTRPLPGKAAPEHRQIAHDSRRTDPETARKFSRLTQAIANREDLAELKAKGEI
jgi:hypothetical protein